MLQWISLYINLHSSVLLLSQDSYLEMKLFRQRVLFIKDLILLPNYILERLYQFTFLANSFECLFHCTFANIENYNNYDYPY